MKKLKIIIFIIPLLFCYASFAQVHPHILVHGHQKQAVLDLIEKQSWAKSVYEQLKEEIDPYVDRHQTNPSWILDRYLMNRVVGKRFTRFISDKDGTELIGFEGDAPVPTVRVSPHKRMPVTQQGQAYRLPSIEELTPKDTSVCMHLQNPATKCFEWVNPQNYVGKLNHQMNELAYHSSVLYWLTSNEKYAKFAADLLDQWAKGASFQQPIQGPGRTGFLDIQTLGDEVSKELILAYDFVYPYMEKKGYDLSYYEVVFDKIAATLAYRGYVGNNWYAAESSTLVAAALSLQNEQKKSYYLDFYLKRDTINDGCGQLGLPSTVNKWFTPDGHWKEPGGYHNYPVSKLIESGFMLENNGYPVFREYPVLLRAAYVMLNYSFPNLTASSFGDTGRPRQDFYCLEIGMKMAAQYKLPVLSNLVQVMELFRNRNQYDRATAGVTGLLCYLPEVPFVASNGEEGLWSRTGQLDFASCFLQRNGMNTENGLMCTMQGASYNHNHSNGMAMELYGKGAVMGVDPGNGPTYEHPLHVGYYTQWAAHNTVVAAGASSSVRPFTGGGGMKEIGAVKLVEKEPKAGSDAVSENYSFVLGEYEDLSTRTQQERLLSLIRMDSLHGYYLDVYESDNEISNDYLYHNIGDTVILYTPEGEMIPMFPKEAYPHTEKDLPGLRYFKSVASTDMYDQSVVAVFPVSSINKQIKMWMPASAGKSYYTALAPASKTAVSPYDKKLTPVVAVRMERETGESPFVVIYEPTDLGGNHGRGIQAVRQFTVGHKQLVIWLDLNGKKEQIIFKGKGLDPVCWKNYTFNGLYGIVTEDMERKSLYLGKGRLLENADVQVSLFESEAVSLTYSSGYFYLRTNGTCRLIVKNRELNKKIMPRMANYPGFVKQSNGEYLVEKGEYKITL